MELPSVSELQQELAALEQQMSDPNTLKSTSRMKELAYEHGSRQELLTALQTLESLAQEKSDVAALAATGDSAELRELAQADLAHLEKQEVSARAALEEILVPRDPRDSRDVIVEIRAGAGGEEAALFAAELFRSYARYAELKGWQAYIVSSSQGEQGGYKEIVAEFSGKGVFGALKYERGVHRVQRVPATEKMGRIHTSTVTVAVLPQAEEVDLTIRKEDLRIDTYRASGAGGQHVNKTSSAIRITHLPTNTVVAVQDERSQHKNKDKAMKILRARLLEAQEQARHNTEAAERKLQVGTGDRSEKIRTYNFPQDRITDHRIKKSWSNIPAVLDGKWEQIFSEVAAAQRQHALGRAAT